MKPVKLIEKQIVGNDNFRYIVKESLPCRPCGAAYLVEDVTSGTQYALKVICPKTRDEVVIMPRLPNHPHIMKCITHWQEGEAYFIVLQYFQHGSVSNAIRDKNSWRQLHEQEALLYLHQVSSAVRHLHTHGFTHGDLDPENVFYSPKHMRVGDLSGAAQAADIRLTQIPSGCAVCLSPQVLSGCPIGKPADMWSLGCVAYTMMSGTDPFVYSGDFEALLKTMRSGPIPLDTQRYSQCARDLISSLLQYDESSRPSIETVMAKLDSIIAGNPTKSPQPVPQIAKAKTGWWPPGHKAWDPKAHLKACPKCSGHNGSFSSKDLYHFCKSESLECVRYLTEATDGRLTYATYNYDSSILYWLASWGKLDVMRYIVDGHGATDLLLHVTKHGDNLLHTAAYEGQLRVARYIVDEKGCVDLLRQTNDNEETVLHEAAYGGHVDIFKYILEEKGETGLLKMKNKSHETPLDVAKNSMAKEVVAYLSRNW
eukprot:Rmarinus@m.1663